MGGRPRLRGRKPRRRRDLRGAAQHTAKVTHRAALPYAEVEAAVAKVRRSTAYRGAVLSFEFLALTAAREHPAPLSDRALAVLDEARRELAPANNLVFPSEKGRMQGHHPMGRMVKALEIGAVPHWFRSSFRDWATECTETPREVCELDLAHVNSDRVEAAYRRRDLFGRRRTLMQDWANYVTVATAPSLQRRP